MILLQKGRYFQQALLRLVGKSNILQLCTLDNLTSLFNKEIFVILKNYILGFKGCTSPTNLLNRDSGQTIEKQFLLRLNFKLLHWDFIAAKYFWPFLKIFMGWDWQCLMFQLLV